MYNAKIFLLRFTQERRIITANTCTACRARVSSRSATNNMLSTRVYIRTYVAREESKERKTGVGERERGERRETGKRTRYLKLHSSVYYLLSAISACTETVHPTDDRRMICALDVLESRRARSMKRRATPPVDRPWIAI